jgi:hypothetical protein
MKKRCLILTLADPSSNPRPRRAFELLTSIGYEVDLASFAMEEDLNPQIHYVIPKGSRGPLHQFTKRCLTLASLPIIYFSILSRHLVEQILLYRFNLVNLDRDIATANYDLILVENIELLALALRHKKTAKVILDAREYYPREFENDLKFKILNAPLMTFLCDRYLRDCDQVITVSPGLVQEYNRQFKVYPALIMSMPQAVEISPSPVLNDQLRLVHHGAANPDRQLENMLDVVKHLDDRFSLDLYLTGNDKYINHLRQLASHTPHITFQKPVKFGDIITMLNSYDVGLYLLEPTNFNTRHALPNKFFEFIQARLMIAIGPSPAMADLVVQHGCGVVAHDFTPCSMAESLNALSADDIFSYKLRSEMAAQQLNWESESKKLEALAQSLIQ